MVNSGWVYLIIKSQSAHIRPKVQPLVRDSHNLRATFHSILQFDSSRWLGSALDG